MTLEKQQQDQQQKQKYYQCYFCKFNTDEESKYLRHGIHEHLYKPLFPNEVELEKYGLTPQGKPWEKCMMTIAEADDRLSRWVEKQMRVEQHQERRKSRKEKGSYVDELEDDEDNNEDESFLNIG